MTSTIKSTTPTSQSKNKDETKLEDATSNTRSTNQTLKPDPLSVDKADAFQPSSSNVVKDQQMEIARVLKDPEVLAYILAQAAKKQDKHVDPVRGQDTRDDGVIRTDTITTTEKTETVESVSDSAINIRKLTDGLGIATFNKTRFEPVFINSPPVSILVPNTTAYSNWKTHKIRIMSTDPTVMSIIPAFKQVPVKLDDTTLHYKLESQYSTHATLEDVSQIKSGSDEVFNSNVAYVVCEPNPEFIEGTNITMLCGVPVAKSVFKSFSCVDKPAPNSIDRLVVASGALAWALNFARRTDVVLKYKKKDKDETNVITLHSNFVATNPLSTVLGRKLMTPMYPSIVLTLISNKLPFMRTVVEDLLDNAPYAVGEARVIRRCLPIEKDTVVTQALNIDTPTAMAVNRTTRVYLQEDFAHAVAEPSLSAYSMSDIVTTVMNDYQELKFGRSTTDDFELSGLLIATAGTKSLFGAILTLNEEAFLKMGTVSPRLTTPTLDNVQTNQLDADLLNMVKTRLSESSFEDAIQTLLLQVTPQLIFPSVVPDVYRVKNYKLLIGLFEILMMFTFSPSVAKFAGAGLARTLRSIISLLWNNEFRLFTDHCGWCNNEPGDQTDPSDIQYWSNQYIPTIFLPDVNFPNGCRNIAEIHRLLRPLVFPYPHQRAQEARFPRLYQNPVTWLPYPPVQPMGAETSPFKLRINAIVEKCKEWIETTGVSNQKSIKARASYLFDCISGAMDCHGLGMSREVGAVLRWMVNRKTFFVDFYDGNLGTPFSRQMALVARDQMNYPQKVNIERRLYRELVVRPQMIWSIIFHFNFKGAHFDPILEDDDACSFNPPIPGDHLAADNALIEASVRLLEPFALTNKIISDDLNVAGVEVLRDLIGRDRLTSADYNAVKRFVGDALSGTTFETEFVRFEGLGHIHATWKIPNPTLRYINEFGQVAELREGDPSIMIHGLKMMREDFAMRFNIGMECIMSPRSAYSRLRKGLIIHRSTLSVDNPYLDEPLAFRPIEIEYDRVAHTVVTEAQHGRFIVYANDGRHYEDENRYPFRTFIIRDLSRLDSRDVQNLIKGVFAGRFRIELPDVYYLFDIKHCARNEVGDQADDVRKLLTSRERDIPQITFYDTELPTYLYRSEMVQAGRARRYIFPMQSITNHVIARGLFCDHTTPDRRYWRDPPPHLCDTGSVNDLGILTYNNGVQKTFDSLCFSNQVIVMGQETDFSGEVYYDEKNVRFLE
nr:P2 protein [Carrot reovirus 1]